AANDIGPPYKIYVRQKLLLPSATGGADESGARTFSRAERAPNPASGAAATRSSEARKAASVHSGLPSAESQKSEVSEGWSWPANGIVMQRFGEPDAGHKGIDIQGELGQPVYAANSGKVVYAGSGLLGYGNLLIIKHNDQYLSAYAHNSRLLVKEGEFVKA